MDKLLHVSASPHIRDARTTQSLMGDVLIALMPAGIAGVYFFGLNALILIAVGVISAVAAEFLCQKAARHSVTVTDLSAAVTGLLLAYNVPATAEWWQVMIGSVFAIVVVKQLFGGLGFNIVNPALAARAVLQASWVGSISIFQLDGVTAATPLSQLKSSGATTASLMDMFLGNTAGCIGEVSALLLILGGVYLLCRRVIKWHVPVSYIGTVAVFMAVYALATGKSMDGFVLPHILGGGLILGAFFMATDYVTRPITGLGQIIFGVGAGILTSVIRLWGGYPEGVSYSILLMNLATPLIDKATKPRIYGSEVKSNA
ncbi:MAG: RnfABCDGE type electron transport complex subunit D [Christensenellales bacterium]|jgi:electron transport complex protein RnfD